MLIINVPNTYIPERTYIVQTILGDILGIDSKLLVDDREDVLIKDNTNIKRTMRIADIFFQTPYDKWLTSSSLPQQPLRHCKLTNISENVPLVDSNIPVIYGCVSDKEDLIESYFKDCSQEIYLGIDIFGAAFFMITRYEEYILPNRDQHDRFPASASLAYQEGFLDRPIINEYIEILWWCLKRLWPGLERKRRSFTTILSHDVDVPFAQTFSGVDQLIRNCGGDILIRKAPVLAMRRITSWRAIKKGDYKQDLNYTFDRIMDISEHHNLKSAFFFKTDYTNTAYDDKYSIDHPYIRQLIRDISNRGHDIGLHPSYETYQDPEQTKLEFQKLLQVCEKEGIQQDQWGGRQHYLRWQVPRTWRNWAYAGLNYDSTLSYAEHAGFRCGICYEYPVYDLEQRKALSFRERPLIVMDGSIFDEQYMNLRGYEALNYIQKLKNRCQLFHGWFILLWHNNFFQHDELWQIYERSIQ